MSSVRTLSLALLMGLATLPVIYAQYRHIRIRSKLPKTIVEWRSPGEKDHEDFENIWNLLGPVLAKHGWTSWSWRGFCMLRPPGGGPGSLPNANGYIYAGSSAGLSPFEADRIEIWQYVNPLNRAVRSHEGRDAVCRIIVVGKEGRNALDALRRLATGPDTLLFENHVLPMLQEIHFQDLILGVFPMTGIPMSWLYGDSALAGTDSSVGDLMDMFLQALEALEFIHSKRVAHRDAFHCNFLVQWQPNSMRHMEIPTSRPRVFLIDFETAISFPETLSYDDCLCTSAPFADMDSYAQPIPTMVLSGQPYSPFLLDLFQVTFKFRFMKTSIQALDDVLPVLVTEGTAAAAHKMLRNTLGALAPQSLLIRPTYDDPDDI
ncbi:hypothetical protein BDZ89DRAFT_1154829 [Hymenopellis radicata]|nr:hypothetical protein BDZ89DRAFT_1154829 [Hymenopellis radicata]